MHTIFSSLDRWTSIEENAIRSWYQIPDAEVVFFCGPGESYNKRSAKLVDAVPGYVEKHLNLSNTNEHGTPYLRYMFHTISELAEYERIAYINSDLILLPEEFSNAFCICHERFDKFLMVGRRWNWPEPAALDFQPEWDAALRDVVKRDGAQHVASTDYFAFTRGVFDFEFPDLVVGRYWWDPWLWHSVMKRDIPVIDATRAVMVIHQNHPARTRSWDKEAKENRELAKEAEDSGVDLDSVPYEMREDFRIVKREFDG